MRFSYDGSKWVADSVALPGADMAALSPDGKLVVATSTTSNSVVLFDSATLANRGTYTTSKVGAGGPYLAPRLGVMNDGRAFFQGGPTDGLTYFDLYSRSFGSIAGNYSFNGGPWFNVSGDGSRMLIVQSAGGTPAPPMLYMNSTDTAAKANPAGLTYWYDATQSLRGERFVDDNLQVWDHDFTLIGILRIPGTGNYFARLPVLSPDGQRAYVLAYADPSSAPRVYVFDTSTKVTSSTGLPLLGYFTLADYPSCNTDLFDSNCTPSLRGTISPDGKTLFFIGDTKLVVTPIPALTASASATDVSSKMRLTVPRH
jgi:DNA-binding beta-propeller fold protein YncE